MHLDRMHFKIRSIGYVFKVLESGINFYSTVSVSSFALKR